MCIILTPCFWLVAILFMLLKEKAAVLVAGFNSLPKAERDKYDKKRMVQDYYRQFWGWGALFLAGAGLCLLISGYMAILIFGLWLVLFFRNVHFDEEKAFGKYKL